MDSNMFIPFIATVIHRKGYLNVASVTQLEKDTLMICHDGECDSILHCM